jgi:hypothetical protein
MLDVENKDIWQMVALSMPTHCLQAGQLLPGKL